MTQKPGMFNNYTELGLFFAGCIASFLLGLVIGSLL